MLMSKTNVRGRAVGCKPAASGLARGGRAGRVPSQGGSQAGKLLRLGQKRCAKVRAAETNQEAGSADNSWEDWSPEGQDEEGAIFNVSLPKPIGVSIGRGNDGRCYVSRVDASRGSIDPRIQPGDKLLRVSQSFGEETWEALNYGQVAYAIRTRNGDVFFQLQSRGGDMSVFEKKKVDSTAAQFQAERAGGNYGIGTKELQQRNYIASKEEARKRRELFDDGLEKFKSKDFENAILDWENVLGLEPANYMGDNFSKVSQIYQVAAYNIACAYSKLGQTDPGLEALDQALNSGFSDYDKCRQDKNLAAIRQASPEQFKEIMDKYDEPIINMDAINAVKNFFTSPFK